MKLKDKVAIITGAGSGIGKGIARAFAAEGALLTIASRSERIEKSAADIKSPVVAVRGDISEPLFVDEMIKKTHEVYGGVDILVNNAGVQGPIGPLAMNDPDKWLETIRINLFGTFLCCRAAIPLMRNRRGGKIINLSGGGSTSPRPRFSAYGASKTAVVRLTETLARELKAFNIQVNAIAPGAVNTRMLDEVLAAGKEAGRKAYMEALHQLKTGGTPVSKPASLAVFLASSDSGELTGKLISAVWDDKEMIRRDLKKINETDTFTLRRVV